MMKKFLFGCYILCVLEWTNEWNILDKIYKSDNIHIDYKEIKSSTFELSGMYVLLLET